MNPLPRNIQELADLYEVHRNTMLRWLRPIRDELLKMNGHRVRRLRSLKSNQIKRIFEFLGEPDAFYPLVMQH